MILPESKNDDLRATWFGRVGQDWKIVRAKNAFRLVSKKVGDRSGEYDLLSLTLKGIIPRDIESGKGKFPESFDTYQEVKKSDLVFCLFDVDETPRTVGLSNLDGMVTGAYTVVRCTNLVDPRFVTYFYLSIDERKGLRPFYTGLRKVVRTETFLNAAFPLPDLPTQRAIADFLDRETARIDTLIEKKQRLVELLGEKKKADVFNIFSDIDAKLWRVRHLGKVKNGAGFPIELQGDASKEIPFFKVKHLAVNGLDQRIKESDDTITEAIAKGLRAIVFPTGTIVFAKIGAALLLGRFSMLGVDGCIDNNLAAFVVNQQIASPDFLLLCFERFEMPLMVQPGAVPSLSTEKFLNQSIALPSLDVQRDVVSRIRIRFQRHEKIKDRTLHSIDRLKEYRSALITSAVTGQIDVTKWTNAETTDRQLDAIKEEFGA